LSQNSQGGQEVSDVQRLKDWYEGLAEGNLESVFAALDSDIEWRQAEGHPYQPSGAPWVGREAIKQNLFAKLGADWEDFAVIPHSFHDAGDIVVVEGRYTGRFKGTGGRLDAQFCHIWQVRNGGLARFQQYVDTGQLQAVAGLSATKGGDWF
jgi:ketosteroid isomerase-like protein